MIVVSNEALGKFMWKNVLCARTCCSLRDQEDWENKLATSLVFKWRRKKISTCSSVEAQVDKLLTGMAAANWESNWILHVVVRVVGN